jgi:hypothetical protein
MRRGLFALATVVLAVTADLTSVAGQTPETGPPQITGRAVGGVALGRSYEFLRAENLVGVAREGCPLTGTEQKTAALRDPLKGTATFEQRGSDLELIAITVRGGARTARGIGVGSTARHALRLYRGARRNKAPRSVFGVDLIQVRFRDRRAFSFVVNARTHRIRQIDVPTTTFCD